VPAAWNPVRVEGDADSGSMLLADLAAARLGIRWRSAGRGDPKKLVDRVIAGEAGDEVPAADSIASSNSGLIEPRLRRDSESQREFFAAYSARRKRVIEIVHTPAEGGSMADRILPSLTEQPAEEDQFWSVFGLHVHTPAEFKLQSYAFNAGDVALHFRHGNGRTIVRRIGPAKLALSRQPLEKWATTLDRSQRKLYRSASLVGSALADRLLESYNPSKDGPPGRTLQDVATAKIPRRRRLFWAWLVPKQLTAIAAVDPVADRLIVGSSNDPEVLRRLIQQAMKNDVTDISAPTEQQELIPA